MVLKKNIDPSHRRILRISLTKKGKQLLETSNGALDELEENLLSGLSDTELNSFRHLLGSILESARERPMAEKSPNN